MGSMVKIGRIKQYLNLPDFLTPFSTSIDSVYYKIWYDFKNEILDKFLNLYFIPGFKNNKPVNVWAYIRFDITHCIPK